MNRKEIQALHDATEKRLEGLLNSVKEPFVKGYHFYDLGQTDTNEFTGIMVEIRVNKVYHYYEMMLKYWKNQLNADEYYITFKCNALVICFKIRKL